MSYNPKLYAKAFCEAAVLAKNNAELEKLIKNFLEAVKKNRDQSKLKEILALVQKDLSQKTGFRKILVEMARELSSKNAKLVDSFAKKNDLVEKKINKNLLAGIKITINDELQFDGSFDKKLKNIFNTNVV